MCLVKVKDFGDALGISGGTIRSKISRGQLLRNKKGLIDTEDPTNYIYLLEVNDGDQKVFEPYHVKPIGRANVNKKVSVANKKATKVSISKENVEIAPKKIVISKKVDSEKPSKIKGSVNLLHTPETKEPKLTAEEKTEKDLAKRTRQTLLEIDIAQKQANLHNIQRTAEIKQMQLEKIMGNTLPLDKVTSIMAINFKAIFKTFHAQSKNIASTMVQNLGGTKEDLNAIMIDIEQILNHIKETSQKSANLDIERLIEEYSQIRSRGERR